MELVMALGSGWVIGLILGMVTGLVASLFLLKDSGTQWLWESRKVERLEKELALAKVKAKEQNLALEWDLQ